MMSRKDIAGRAGRQVMKKTITVILLVVAMVASILPMQAFAAGNGIDFELGKVTASTTDTEVKVPLTVTGNEGFATLDFFFFFDPAALRLKAIELESWIRDNGSAPVSQSYSTGKYKICLGDALAHAGFSETGLLGEIVFTVLDGAAAGQYAIRVTNAEAYDPREAEMTVHSGNGSVTLKSPESEGGGEPAHDCPSKGFADFDPNAWYHEAVDYAVVNGLMKGTSPITFEPGTTTTRAMIVTILWRLEGEPVVNAINPFDDVVNGAWYTDAIVWAAANGIVDGYGDGRFGPADEITREQLATILFRYAKYKDYDVSAGENTNILFYDDAGKVSTWAMPAMQWAIGEGLIRGRTESTIVPQGRANRAEAAAIFMRFIENGK